MNKFKIITTICCLFSLTANAELLYEGALEKRINTLEVMLETMSNNAKTTNLKLYGSVRAAFEYEDLKTGGSTGTIKSLSSRIGINGTKKIDDDLKGIYRVEFGQANGFGLNNPLARFGYVGLDGDYGDIRLGTDITGAYYLVASKVDIFVSSNGLVYEDFDSAAGLRVRKAVHYRNKIDDIKIQAAVQFDNDTTIDVDFWNIAGSTQFSGIDLGVYFNTKLHESSGTLTIDNTTQLGIGISGYPLDSVYLAAAFYVQNAATDNDTFSAYDIATAIDTDIIGNGGSIRIIIGAIDYKADCTAADTTTCDYNKLQVGVRKQYSGYRLFAWYYTRNNKEEIDNNPEASKIVLGARYDF